VTSLLLSLQHAVTALILNFTTVGAEVLTSRPGRFTPGNTQAFIVQDTDWVPETFCMFWSKEKCLQFPNFQHRFLHIPANRLVTVCLCYWANQGK